jgi:hypothetical protein
LAFCETGAIWYGEEPWAAPCTCNGSESN